MFRFIHTADWQLGARFSQFGASGVRLREARLTTLTKALALASQHAVDAFIIAGDLFEDNQVDDALVAAVVKIFAAYSSVPIFILPGNHDPFTGPESVWQRKSMRSLPAHVRLLTSSGVIDLGGVFLLASPLQQKLSATDPSARFVELASSLPFDAIKIGITHGALAIEGKHQPNDFPIALNAASRAGLDYLAIGHWHNWLTELDGGRIVMPGTPEPDRFSNDASGRIALVEIDGPRQLPRVQALPVATLTWRAFMFDFTAAEASRASLTAALAELSPAAASTVLRVSLTGIAAPTALAEIRSWLSPALSSFLVGQLVDRTRIGLTTAELADLRARHPILAHVLADIDRLETFATGSLAPSPISVPLSAEASPTATQSSAPTVASLTLSEAQALLAPAKIDLASLSPELLAQLRQTIFQTLQEVGR